MATSSGKLPEGVEKVEEGAEDTSKRAYFGTQSSAYPFEPEPGMRYVLVTEHPDAWGLESMFGRYERMGYRMKQFANSKKNAAWYELPQAIYDKREDERRQVRDEQRKRAKDMIKTSSSMGVQTWVQKDELKRSHPIINNPIVFNG